MLDGMTLEELNAVYDADHDPMSMDYEEYFEEMELTDSQKKKRKDAAEKLEDVFEWLLALTFYYMQENVYDYTDAIAEAQKSYEGVVTSVGAGVSDFFKTNHIPTTVMNTVGTMLKNPDNIFNYTNDRARMIAENEANSIWNDAEFEEALASGMTRKTWHAIIDRKTRDTHRPLDGKTIPINEPFEVGEYLMMYPRSEELGAGGEEIVNCRCSVSYS